MSRALRLTLLAGAVLATTAWTLAALAAWWLLQIVAGALDGGSAASAMQAFNAWTDRAWVQRWLDPQEIEALRDGLDWLLGLGGGPATWLGTAVTLLTVALVVFWAGGLLIAALVTLAVVLLVRKVATWQREDKAKSWTTPAASPPSGDATATP